MTASRVPCMTSTGAPASFSHAVVRIANGAVQPSL
jgi:hypothetical protein